MNNHASAKVVAIQPPLEPAKPLFPALTGVRMLAAYLVFMHHFTPPVEKLGTLAWGIFSEGHVGVTMFFVLSGFLIAYRYDKLRVGQADLKTYYWNRFARIYPLYFLLLVPTLILMKEHRFGHWLVEMTLFKGFFDEYKFAGIAQAWSLTAEECFYLAAPLLLPALCSRFRAGVLPACYVAGAVLLGIGMQLDFHQFFGNPRFVCGYTFFGRALEFLLGAWMAMNLPRLEAFKSVPHKTYLGLGGILAVAFVLNGLKQGAVFGVLCPQGAVLNNLMLPFAIGLFYLGLIQDNSLLKRLLCTGPCQLLGKSSYAFYLIHLGFISQFLALHTKGVWFFVALNVVAIALYKLVEEPINLYLRARGPKRKPAMETLVIPQPRLEKPRLRAA